MSMPRVTGFIRGIVSDTGRSTCRPLWVGSRRFPGSNEPGLLETVEFFVSRPHALTNPAKDEKQGRHRWTQVNTDKCKCQDFSVLSVFICVHLWRIILRRK